MADLRGRPPSALIHPLRNEKPMYMLFSGSGGGFENGIKTTAEPVGEEGATRLTPYFATEGASGFAVPVGEPAWRGGFRPCWDLRRRHRESTRQEAGGTRCS